MKSCYKTIDDMIAKSMDTLGDKYTVNKDRFKDIRLLCEQFDELIEDSFGVGCDAKVDFNSNEIVVCVTCESIAVQVDNHPFYSIADRSKSIQVEWCKVGGVPMIKIYFTLPGVWDEKK